MNSKNSRNFQMAKKKVQRRNQRHRDLKHTCEVCNLLYNIKSHSFRVNVISNLLKITTVQNTADIIGHQDIRSTMTYRRYALSKEEINDLLEKIADNETQNQ
jgi:integrase